jgi:hypothetical protein
MVDGNAYHDPAWIGPVALQRTYQCKRQVWPHLDQHTYPPATGRVAVRRLVAFPVTVTADKKPTDIVKKSPG